MDQVRSAQELLGDELIRVRHWAHLLENRRAALADVRVSSGELDGLCSPRSSGSALAPPRAGHHVPVVPGLAELLSRTVADGNELAAAGLRRELTAAGRLLAQLEEALLNQLDALIAELKERGPAGA